MFAAWSVLGVSNLADFVFLVVFWSLLVPDLWRLSFGAIFLRVSDLGIVLT